MDSWRKIDIFWEEWCIKVKIVVLKKVLGFETTNGVFKSIIYDQSQSVSVLPT